MLAIYRRVSTEEQNTEAQTTEIQRWLDYAEPGCEYRVYEDHGQSGTKQDRPGLMQMLKDCEDGLITHVVVYRLDRLTRRGAGDVVSTIHKLDELGIKFTSVTEQHLSHTNPMRMTFFAMFGDIASIERSTLIERTNAGIAAAKARGVKFGAPVQYDDTDVRRVAELRAKGYSYRKIARMTGISKSTAQRLLTKRA